MILFYVKRITDGKMSLEDERAKWKVECDKYEKLK